MIKKDWDEDLIVDYGKWLATDLKGQKSFQLKEISDFLYNPDDYIVSVANAKEATKKLIKY